MSIPRSPSLASLADSVELSFSSPPPRPVLRRCNAVIARDFPYVEDDFEDLVRPHVLYPDEDGTGGNENMEGPWDDIPFPFSPLSAVFPGADADAVAIPDVVPDAVVIPATGVRDVVLVDDDDADLDVPEAYAAPRSREWYVAREDKAGTQQNWVLTKNNWTEADKALLFSWPRLKYCLCAPEVGANGTAHLQIYLEADQAVRYSAMDKYFKGFWFAKAKASKFVYQWKYITKDGVAWEKGIRPKMDQRRAVAKRGGESTKRKWDLVKSQAVSGKLDEIESEVFVKHYNVLRTIARDRQVKPADLPPIDEHRVGYWYYGKAGTGKTFAAIKDFPDAYRKISNNKWWCGYQDEDNVIIDDLDKEHKYMGYHLKIWGDRYAFTSEVKGSFRFIRPRHVVVTSNYHPRDIWDDEQTLAPILRRFKVVNFQSLAGLLVGDPEEETREPWVPVSATAANFTL